MGSEKPSPDQSGEQPTQGEVIPDKRIQKRRMPSPSAAKIKEQSKSRNSLIRLSIVGGIAFGLILALIADVIVQYLVWNSSTADSRPYSGYAKDILLVISSIAAYLLGKGTGERKEDE
jgi:hypothetical protein